MMKRYLVASGLVVALGGCVGRNVGGEAGSGGVGSSGVENGSGGSGVGATEPTGEAGSGGGEVSSSGVGSGTGASAGTSGEESGFSFVPRPDGGEVGGIQCDVFKQDCGPGEKCAAWAEGGGGTWNATKCVMVMGDQKPGEACMTQGGGVSGLDDCAKGAMCWDVNAENVGVCVALCEGNEESPVCGESLSCFVGADGVLNLCVPCNPLVQECTGDQLCVMVGDEAACVDDASGEMGAVNDPCAMVDACDKGLACVETGMASSACMQGSPGCCQPFCEFIEGEDGDCPNVDQKCLPWFGADMQAPWGFGALGFCGIAG